MFERWCPEPNAPLVERGREELYLCHGRGSRCELYDMKSSVESPVVGKKNIQIPQIADQHKKVWK